MSETKYTPQIFLHVDVTSAAEAMVLGCGGMSAFMTAGNPFMVASEFHDIQSAVERAARSVANYKRAMADGRTLLTRDEYEAAPPIEPANANEAA